MIKAIKTQEDYEAALEAVGQLMDAEPGSPEENDLEVLAVLIEAYEADHFPIGSPDPVDAILFRMDQMGLTRKDLIPLIGSQSKVSEVLNRKKPLSLAMIRRLNTDLDIPAEVLIGIGGQITSEPAFRMEDFPFKQMFNAGYFSDFTGTLREAKDVAEELLTAFFSKISLPVSQPVYCRHSDRVIDTQALHAWQTQAAYLAKEKTPRKYQPSLVTYEFLRDIIKLSRLETGPLNAQELLAQKGIALVYLPALPGTYLDGASFLGEGGQPVIGMTIRYDRLDNFWFTLAHELAHVKEHLGEGNSVFFDDTEQGNGDDCDVREVQANQVAKDVLIPNHLWEMYGNQLIEARDEEGLFEVADIAGVSVSIIAGRIRRETGDYRRFTTLVGHRTVRKLFENGACDDYNEG